MCFAHLWWFNLLLRVRIDQEVHVFILLDDTCNTVNYSQRWAVYSIQNTKVLLEYTFGSHRLFRLLENAMAFFEAFFGNLLYKCMKIEFTKMEGGGVQNLPPPPPYENAESDQNTWARWIIFLTRGFGREKLSYLTNEFLVQNLNSFQACSFHIPINSLIG